jgi:hypothetical protein
MLTGIETVTITSQIIISLGTQRNLSIGRHNYLMNNGAVAIFGSARM